MSNFIVLNFYFQIAQNPANDKKRNFALVDVGNAADAEKLWSELDGAVVKEKCVRMAYSNPGQTGASLIGGQPKKTGKVSGVYIWHI